MTRAPDFDALLRKGTLGIALERFADILVPSAVINTYGPAVVLEPEPGYFMLYPCVFALHPAGVAALETLVFKSITTFADGSTATIDPMQEESLTVFNNVARTRGKSGNNFTRWWEEFEQDLAANGGAGVVKVQYQVKSSIALSVATVPFTAFLWELS